MKEVKMPKHLVGLNWEFVFSEDSNHGWWWSTPKDSGFEITGTVTDSELGDVVTAHTETTKERVFLRVEGDEFLNAMAVGEIKALLEKEAE
jgi:hypothetical protein